jgi:hypothetical protein
VTHAGIRHRLVVVLSIAVVATLAGAANYRELGSVAVDLPRQLLRLLGARWDQAGRRFTAPSAATLRRVLIALDADELDAAVGAWLREHATCDEAGWAIALDGKDLRASWDAEGRLALFSAMTHWVAGQDAVVLGQIRVPEGTTETTQVRALLDPMNITGALVTADAESAVLARDLVEAGLGKVEMLIEYQLPLTSMRADVVLAGVDARTGGDRYVVVELKQWSQAELYEDDEHLILVPGSPAS